MTAAARVLRPLPGVRFEVAAPPLTDVLPRMDVAVFVGFAASGPLHVPVAVEDAAHFEAIFGADAPLAWSAALSGTLYAYLAPAVRAFFKNGGVRCWVVRVADAATATTNVFPVPGLAVVGDDGKMVRAQVAARSPGSWSDPLLVGDALFVRPFSLLSGQPVTPGGAPSWMGFALGADVARTPTVDALLVSPSDVVVGDMLRVTFGVTAASPGGSLLVMFIVATIDALSTSSGGAAADAALYNGQRSWTRFTGRNARWFQTAAPATVNAASAGFADLGGGVLVPAQGFTPPADDGTCSVVLSLVATAAPAPGSVLAISFGAEALWLTVDSATTTSVAPAAASPIPPPYVQVVGRGLWSAAAPASLANQLPLLERLSLRLSVMSDAGIAVQLDDLGFDTAHPRALWALPSDAELFGGDLSPVPASDAEPAPRASLADTSVVHAALTAEASDPRFPLAARGSAGAVYYPVGVGPVGGPFLGCSPGTATARARDGLAVFGAKLFVDPALAGAFTTDITALADAVRYASTAPRALSGLHAALEIDEATLIAVPDAGHAGWDLDPAPLPVPDAAPPPSIPGGDRFLACGPRSLAAPAHLRVDPAPDSTGTFTLAWDATAGATAYVIHESTSGRFEDAVEVATVTQPSWVVWNRSPADYTYWVRGDATGLPAAWSAGLVVRVDTAQSWVARPVANATPTTGAAVPPPQAADLLDVQRALLRLCCARGDLFAVLALPDGYRDRDAVGHAAALRALAVTVSDGLVPPLGFGEAAALSFGALYHPWLMSRDEGALADVRQCPPDGAATGILARRAIDRGAWISPANVVPSGVVALSPAVPRRALSVLQDAQVNAFRQEARGFVCLGDDTLSPDPDLLSINVRRLLSLLRRAALSLGAGYVFEPNDARLTRLVQRGFGGLLGTLFQRGAFAGATPAQAFQLTVVTDPGSADAGQGRFIVDVSVAPSLPLRFLTVRLVQTGDGGVTTERR